MNDIWATILNIFGEFLYIYFVCSGMDNITIWVFMHFVWESVQKRKLENILSSTNILWLKIKFAENVITDTCIKTSRKSLHSKLINLLEKYPKWPVWSLIKMIFYVLAERLHCLKNINHFQENQMRERSQKPLKVSNLSVCVGVREKLRKSIHSLCEGWFIFCSLGWVCRQGLSFLFLLSQH